MSDAEIVELNYENFEDEVFGRGKPVLVEFWSETSYACRELDGIVNDLAAEYQGRLIFARLDVDTNWQTASQYEVRTTPAVLLFQNDQVIDRIEGPKPREEYRQAINEVISQYWVI